MFPYNQYMTSQNYTPIDELVRKIAEPTGMASTTARETEPVVTRREAIGRAIDEFKINEVVEHEPSAEVSTFVQSQKETISIPPDLKTMGVAASSHPSYKAYKEVVLPLDDEQVIAGLAAPVSSSIRWLAEFCLHILKKSHLTLKSLHGTVFRISRT